MGIDLDPNSFLCHVNAGSTQMALQQYDEAISSFETALKLSNRHFFTVHAFIWTYCKIGRFDKARELMSELKERSQSEYVANTFTALSAGYLNDLDEAFNYLEKAYDDRDPVLIMLKYEQWVPAALREDPRFQQLLDRIGFPE